MHARSYRFWWTVCALALLACGKAKGPETEGNAPTAGSGNGGGNAEAGKAGAGKAGSVGSSGAPVTSGSGGRPGTAGSGGTTVEGGSQQGGEPGCATNAPPDTPLRRLSRFEYENSLRELFGEQSFPSDALPLDPYGDPTSPPSPDLVEAQHHLARELAFRATQTETATLEFVGCDAAVEGEEVCRDRFIGEFVQRVFRRPLTDLETEEFTNTFDGAASGGNFALGVRATIQVALQSPEFLYLPEFGLEAPERGDGWARPSPYEMASRLAYFVWGSPPDAELLQAARDDALRSPDEIEAQARRMLGDDRAFKAVGHFYVRLLQLEAARFSAVGLAQYPTFTPEVASHLLGETETFVADATLASDADLRSLLTAPHTFVNEPLAAFYGISGVSGNEFQRVDVDPSRRGGLLTHASFLATTTLGPFTNPTGRGTRILNAFLCQSIPEHPADVAVPDPLPPNTTTRQRLVQSISEPTCVACHALLDPLGFAFEHYDAAGLYRDTENGLAIDATGTLVTNTSTLDFDGALELADLLAGSEDVRRCFVEQWFAFALRRAVTPADACYVSALDREFVDAGTNLQELLISLVRNDSFLYRPEVTP